MHSAQGQSEPVAESMRESLGNYVSTMLRFAASEEAWICAVCWILFTPKVFESSCTVTDVYVINLMWLFSKRLWFMLLLACLIGLLIAGQGGDDALLADRVSSLLTELRLQFDSRAAVARAKVPQYINMISYPWKRGHYGDSQALHHSWALAKLSNDVLCCFKSLLENWKIYAEPK